MAGRRPQGPPPLQGRAALGCAHCPAAACLRVQAAAAARQAPALAPACGRAAPGPQRLPLPRPLPAAPRLQPPCGGRRSARPASWRAAQGGPAREAGGGARGECARVRAVGNRCLRSVRAGSAGSAAAGGGATTPAHAPAAPCRRACRAPHQGQRACARLAHNMAAAACGLPAAKQRVVLCAPTAAGAHVGRQRWCRLAAGAHSLSHTPQSPPPAMAADKQAEYKEVGVQGRAGGVLPAGCCCTTACTTTAAAPGNGTPPCCCAHAQAAPPSLIALPPPAALAGLLAVRQGASVRRVRGPVCVPAALGSAGWPEAARAHAL